jgi:hypothetical protein
MSCGGKDEENTSITPKTAADVVAFYNELKLPTEISDTNIIRKMDTSTLSYEAMTLVVPDSILSTYTSTAKGNKIHPFGKITKDEELYLLTAFTSNKQPALVAFVFDKKNKFLGHLLILNTQKKDGYLHSVAINKEPTFFVTKQKDIPNTEAAYTRHSFAFNKDARGFINVMTDSNEDIQGANTIINPIDTLAHTFKYSGEYVKDKKNFISLRDGRTPASYLFFIHFEKNEGDCTGELKGTLNITAPNKAVFSAGGDPCVIDFTFKGNSIIVKEQGSCGNHRGIKCYFDDTYNKKKETVVKSKKKKTA